MSPIANFASSKIEADHSNGNTEPVDTETADGPSEKSHDGTADARPLGHDESDGELGAFDDSHLQVNQLKKKKRNKRKPKSKRGRVRVA